MNPVYDFFSFLSFFFLEESGRVARLLVGLACLNCSILFIFFFFFFYVLIIWSIVSGNNRSNTVYTG